MIPANAVTIVKVLQPQCRIPGCHWTGDAWNSYGNANQQRETHLAEHREREAQHGGETQL